jgi:hypothetical protein
MTLSSPFDNPAGKQLDQPAMIERIQIPERVLTATLDLKRIQVDFHAHGFGTARQSQGARRCLQI